MKDIIKIITYLTLLTCIFLFSCKYGRNSTNNLQPLKEKDPGVFILHDDFTNLMIAASGSPGKEGLEAAARQAATSGADIISLNASLGEICFYYPSEYGENTGLKMEGKSSPWHIAYQQLIREGIDPYGVILSEINRQGIPVLAKFRVNDRHHIAGHPQHTSQFWKNNPQWYIGDAERDTNLVKIFQSHPSVTSHVLREIERDRPRLLDYAIQEVRDKRLAIFREVIERYDVAGATLNFLREPYCVSFPEKNGKYLTEFVRQCRQILDEVLGAKGIKSPILGALLPWDIDFCRLMGMEVDVWIKEGLLDYVSPSEGWVTDFNADIQPWINLASNTSCAVYPAIVGLISNKADFCLPEQYKTEGTRFNSAKIMPEHVRALAHRFYTEGADGLSSFNLYSAQYKHLFPISDLIKPEFLDAGDRSYIYLKNPHFKQYDFLQLFIPANSSESRSVHCKMYEQLNGSQANLRFKVRNLKNITDMSVFVNDREIPTQQLTTIPTDSIGFLYIQYSFKPGDLRMGDNELVFSLNKPARKEIIVQEIEIRVNPQYTVHPVFKVDYGRPTADKPQSKLWYAGKSWWALIPTSTGPSLWQRTDDGWKEHTDVTKSLAGVQGRADVWAEDEKVMAVAVKDIKNTNHSISVFHLRMKNELSGIRWEADILTELFPPSPDETIETATITRDSKWNWWTAAVAGTNVYIWNSSSEGMNWTDPILLAQGIDLDDICVVTPLPNDEIGVIWSDQVRDAVLMRTHKDAEPAGSWNPEEIIEMGNRTADDHLNTALSPDGTLWVATKNSVDSIGQPQFVLRIRSPNGKWTNKPYVIKGPGHWQSRPIVIATEDNSYVFAGYGGNDIPESSVNNPAIICSVIDTCDASILGDPRVVISPDSIYNSPVQNITGPRHPFPPGVPWIVLASDLEGRIYEADLNKILIKH